MDRPTVGAEGMFLLFEKYPDLMPRADVDATNCHQKTVERSELHLPCIRCGTESACVFLTSHLRAGYRWIDLCSECAIWVREALKRMGDRLAGS